MKSVCSAWRVDEGWQLAANAVLPESSNHINVDDVVIGGIRGIRVLDSLLDGGVEGIDCRVNCSDEHRIEGGLGRKQMRIASHHNERPGRRICHLGIQVCEIVAEVCQLAACYLDGSYALGCSGCTRGQHIG